MRKSVTKLILLAAIVLMGSVGHANAQLPMMGPPIPTTIVISKPAPGEIYGNKQVITVGLGNKPYKFILKDGYTNHLKIRWPDIWEYIQQFNPNLVVQGPDSEKFAQIQPGQTVTVSGMFAPLDRTFEVMSVGQGTGPSEQPRY